MSFTRRSLLKLASILPFSTLPHFTASRADDRSFSHAISLFGDIKYPASFKQFDYVNIAAPKGGKLRMGVFGSFDNLNPYTFKGDAANITNNETLMIGSLDEPATQYGLIAESVWYPEDKSQAVFRLRPEARFHDGKPITVDDVIWSVAALRAGLPDFNSYFRDIAKVEQTGEHEVTFIFSKAGNRELPQVAGGVIVLPKHWWTGTDAQGKVRDISKTTLELPLGSGPYKAVDAKAGASTLMRRVPDYWGKDLPLNVGQNNFDEIETLYFRDANVVFEALKGDQFDFRLENSSKNWATGYDIPAVREKRLLRSEFKLKIPRGMQCYTLNQRREKFQDVRVRKALNLAFDFEWTNANLFYGLYTRCRSYFNSSRMEATGLPSAAELALLTPLKDQIPAEVFTTAYSNPVNLEPQDRRKNLRAASQLLDEAGWKISPEDSRPLLRNSAGQTLSIEFLLNDPAFERITLPYQKQLQLLGIDVKIRTVDPAQFTRQQQEFDYDIIVTTWGQPNSPGNEQRVYWGSETADKPGSQNYIGIKNPAVDNLIDQIIMAKTREDLDTACKALDRVLMWNHYVVPMWYSDVNRLAYWDRFGIPDTKPDYGFGFPSTWWWDAEKAAKVKAG